MQCPQFLEILESALAGEASPEAWGDLESHAKRCAGCRPLFDAGKRLQRFFEEDRRRFELPEARSQAIAELIGPHRRDPRGKADLHAARQYPRASGPGWLARLVPTAAVIAFLALLIWKYTPEWQRDHQNRPDAAPSLGEALANKGDGVPTAKPALLPPVGKGLHDASLYAGDRYHRGAEASMRVSVQVSEGPYESVALPGATVSIELTEPAGGVVALWGGHTGADGIAQARFTVPDLPPGQYPVRVDTKSIYGEQRFTRAITILEDAKALLTTDKALYQPGQEVTMRVLALQSATLRPVAGREIVFEVADPKGTKIFKQRVTTNEFGVASAALKLAQEIDHGAYAISAQGEGFSAQKSVQVRKYVLPPFSVTLDLDSGAYRPGDTVKGALSATHRHGLPVAGAEVELLALTNEGDPELHAITAKTDAAGRLEFEFALPDNAKTADAVLERAAFTLHVRARVRDVQTEHEEKSEVTAHLSRKPLSVGIIPDGGEPLPGVENRFAVLCAHPDGKPAADVAVTFRAPYFEAQASTDALGIAEFLYTVRADRLENPRQDWDGDKYVRRADLALSAEARDAFGNLTRIAQRLSITVPEGGVLALRPEQGIVAAGQPLQMEVLSSLSEGRVFLDVRKAGQVCQQTTVAVSKGRATPALTFDPGVWGTLVLHAYMPGIEGAVIEDRRVVYVQSRRDLSISASPLEHAGSTADPFLPGQEASIRFTVLDADKNPTQAALGVVMFDKALLALQPVPRGLEKLTFTLAEESFKPQKPYAIEPPVSMRSLVSASAIDQARARAARVLLSGAKPAATLHFSDNQRGERRQALEQRLQRLFSVLIEKYAPDHAVAEILAPERRALKRDLFSEMIAAGVVKEAEATDPWGRRIESGAFTGLEEALFEGLAPIIAMQRLKRCAEALSKYAGERAELLDKSRNGFALPHDILDALVEAGFIADVTSRDPWGYRFLLDRQPGANFGHADQRLREYHLYSPGPDRVPGNSDDISGHQNLQWRDLSRIGVQTAPFYRLPADSSGAPASVDFAFELQEARKRKDAWLGRLQQRFSQFGTPEADENEGGMDLALEDAQNAFDQMADGAPVFGGGEIGGVGGMPPAPGAPMDAPMPLRAGRAREEQGMQRSAVARAQSGAAVLDRTQARKSSESTATETVFVEPVRVRQDFRETLVFEPALITDEKGDAVLKFRFDDSNTTWRLDLTANDKTGHFGQYQGEIVAFQDFFVEPDLPVALTQNDRISLPVMLYNEGEAQEIEVTLEAAPWYELQSAASQRKRLESGQRGVLYFPMRAIKAGIKRPLTVTARGTRFSDKVIRKVDVTPDGDEKLEIINGRLSQRLEREILIPENAIEGSSTIFVRLYPGVFSQVLEGSESLLQRPGGCFEQTSSATYPNILVLDYLRQTEQNRPDLEERALDYIRQGYQRLVSFEVPGGGYSWFGQAPANQILTAYGVLEFFDMTRMAPDVVDPAVLLRTQQWLVNQQQPDGSWKPDAGYLHSENWQKIQNSNLLVTAYILRALIESKAPHPDAVTRGLQYVVDHLDEVDANYTRGFLLDCLIAARVQDSLLDAVLKTVVGAATVKGDLAFWDAGMPTATFAHGDSAAIETTATLVRGVLASKRPEVGALASQALAWLINRRDARGGFGGTMATILTYKALLAGIADSREQIDAVVKVSVNDSPAIEHRMDKENFDVARTFDGFQPFVKPGRNRVVIAIEGAGGSVFQVVARHYVPRAEVKAPFALDVSYAKTTVTQGEETKVTLAAKSLQERASNLVMVEFALAPGFEIAGEDPTLPFTAMVASGAITRFEQRGAATVLYLNGLAAGAEFRFELAVKAKFPAEVAMPKSRVWEYYNEEIEAFSGPATLKIKSAP